jgi:hypothetical protein
MIVRSLFVLAALAVVAPAASADIISYSESFSAGGTLDGQSFTSLVFSASADSSTIQQGPQNSMLSYYVIAPVYVTATLSNGGTLTDEIFGSITLDAGFFVSNTGQSNVAGGSPVAGFFDNYNGSQVFIGTADSSFKTYDLSTLTVVTNSLTLDSGNSFKEKTVDGSLIITSNPSGLSTFAAVPEPSSIVMTGIALVIGGGVQLRRRRNAKAARATSAV